MHSLSLFYIRDAHNAVLLLLVPFLSPPPPANFQDLPDLSYVGSAYHRCLQLYIEEPRTCHEVINCESASKGAISNVVLPAYSALAFHEHNSIHVCYWLALYDTLAL